jgi:hypothetical protein
MMTVMPSNRSSIASKNLRGTVSLMSVEKNAFSDRGIYRLWLAVNAPTLFISKVNPFERLQILMFDIEIRLPDY